MLSTAAAVYQSPMAKYAAPQYLALRVARAVFLHEPENTVIVHDIPYFYYATDTKYRSYTLNYCTTLGRRILHI